VSLNLSIQQCEQFDKINVRRGKLASKESSWLFPNASFFSRIAVERAVM